MHRLKAILLLGAALLFAAADCQAQTVYGPVRAYSMGRCSGPVWTIGTGSARFGLSEYCHFQDAAGNRLYSFSDVTAKGVACPEFTVMHLGSYSREVKAPIGVVAGVTFIGLASLVVLACAGRTISRRAVSPTPAA